MLLLKNKKNEGERKMYSIIDTLTNMFQSDTPFSIAKAKKLIGKDINFVSEDSLKMPLHIACRFGNLELVEYLIKQGADINAKSRGDLTPLFMACYHGQIDIAKVLIANNCEIDTIDYEGKTVLNAITPLALIEFTCPELVQVLLDAGADMNIKDRRSDSDGSANRYKDNLSAIDRAKKYKHKHPKVLAFFEEHKLAQQIWDSTSQQFGF